ncbi:MAG TPA: LamG-like jellyroll fold domain-containing protein [Pirellulaceae bacterium]|jgi:hypothetical protein|nr:LamG-like jellyroll fold domain-containing protein [Pirellulaceae bacterium]
MISNYSIRRERLIGSGRENAVRAPQPNVPLSTRQQGGIAAPKTLAGARAPRVGRAPEMNADVWAFRGAEGLTYDSKFVWPSTEFAVSLLVRLRSVATQQALIAADDGSQRSFSLMSLPDGALRFTVYSGASSTALNTSTAYAPGRWRWVTAEFEPGSLRLFVDRNDASTVAGPASWNAPTAALTVGWRDDFGFEDRLDGDVAWFGVWTRSLPRAQLRDLHRRLRPPSDVRARSVFGWPFPASRAFAPIAALAGPPAPLGSPGPIVG